MGNGSQSKAAWKRQAATIAHTKKQHIIKQQKNKFAKKQHYFILKNCFIKQ